MLTSLVNFDYLGDLRAAVAKDLLLLFDAILIGLAIIILSKGEGPNAGEERQEHLKVVLSVLLLRGKMGAELHLFEGAFKIGEGAVAANSLEGS
jgi:hypothetical protein